MSKAKVAITIDSPILKRVDRLVNQHVFANRSQAIEQAVEEKLERLEGSRLARECAKLNPGFEQSLAEEASAEGLCEWPEY
ncbi:MAG: ribbon-helix-helix protein, CopG family [Gammaproteobacteria bacterium]|nr:MAG: ribbon-helix-helix protein, CopG family [Gammaproteobacteria bacterium]